MITLQFSSHATTSGVKEITHGGRRYLVSPVVALREGILNEIYVGAAEFGKFAQSWAGRPIPISHPKAGGLHTTANTPDIWANDVLGHFWNVEVANGALKGEIWIDLDKAQLMGERAISIVNRLRAQEQMEVSTAYFCDMEVKPGTWGGKPYTGVAHNIRPDHLAILPDEAGACSWADGCGTPRVNNARRKPTGAASGGDDSDCGCKEQLMGEEFSSLDRPRRIADNETSAVQHEKTPADVSANEKTLFDRFLGWLGAQKPEPETVTNVSIHEEGTNMAKAELIANEEVEEIAAPVPDPASGSPLGAQPTASSPDSALVARIAALEDVIKGLTANQSEEKAGLIAGIVANCRGAFQADDLAGFDTNKLRGIYGSYMPRDYSANAGAYRDMSGPEDEELLMRWPMFEKKEG